MFCVARVIYLDEDEPAPPGVEAHAVQLSLPLPPDAPFAPYDAVAVPGGVPGGAPPVLIARSQTVTVTTGGPPVAVTRPEPVTVTLTTGGGGPPSEDLPTATIRTATVPVASSHRAVFPVPVFPPVLPTETQPVSLGPDHLLPQPGQQEQNDYSYSTPWLVPAEEGVYPNAYENLEAYAAQRLNAELEDFDPNANPSGYASPPHMTSGPITGTASSRQVTSESEV